MVSFWIFSLYADRITFSTLRGREGRLKMKVLLFEMLIFLDFFFNL